MHSAFLFKPANLERIASHSPSTSIPFLLLHSLDSDFTIAIMMDVDVVRDSPTLLEAMYVHFTSSLRVALSIVRAHLFSLLFRDGTVS